MTCLRSSLVATAGLFLGICTAAFAENNVNIISAGQRTLLIQGGGQSVLLNPYRAVGCAAGLPERRWEADVVLANSQLPDEGAKEVAMGRFLAIPGSYRINGLAIEGFTIPHDRLGGRRFGNSTVWRWKQAGLTFAHIGAAAGELSGEDIVLLSNPDVLIIGVGGGSKIYNGEEAAAIVKQLQPKRIIPIQYVNGTIPKNCDQSDIEPFLKAMGETNIEDSGQTLTLPEKLSNEILINLMR